VGDERFMRQALKLAQSGLGNTSPNPLVGVVVVDPSGNVVGAGYHEKAGADHAEVVALRQAGDRARGGTLYVTLEPCVHHGRTPPCVDAIKVAGISRVVSALADPDPRVAGAGHTSLRDSGIEVSVGMEADQATHANRMYLRHRTTGLPFVTLKMAQSLNGTIASRPGERRQLSGKRASNVVRKLRFEHDAVMVGVGTILIDDPQLTVRPFKPRAVPYTRVIVDAKGRIPMRARAIKDQARFRTIVATTNQMPGAVREGLIKRSVAVLECARSENDRVDLGDLLSKLGSENILSVLCEGGPTLAGSLLAGRHLDELWWLIAPIVLNAEEAVPVVGNGAYDLALHINAVKRLGDDVLVTARVKR